ncbi:hypothetical protein P175DRAFT_0444679 [Aspergillus ochraceoroseus IBT 24754]|uniref:F-box domain-containing protein n=1 Tax=Aspergillus ochraceoroseus IBT 24754 TaxID=1392256 RepID=A0A2T5LPS4_9EURO|nr:uncharacterized protein P175DRAFT_0444679 [Aspergillus ochraceoroseus IBT 24754]PTU18290.1 hypothetical protein P175DRAFT_0444679 [Aspergillus ochraceoroseus IBT 24754]
MPEEKHGFRAFIAHALRPKKSRQVLRKNFTTSNPDLSTTTFTKDNETTLAPLEAHRLKYRHLHAQQDTQLGETHDHTTILHTIGVHNFDTDSDADALNIRDERPPGEPFIASLPDHLWAMIAEYLSPAEVACLAFASRTLYTRLGPAPWRILNEPESTDARADFLVSQDKHYPHHLLCFPCGKFHRRIQEGREKLQPANVINPLFDCPNARNNLRPPPRHRITHGRSLPFSFVQLVLRANRFHSPRYGLPAESLCRRWRRDNWTHQSRFHVHHGRLLMRVVSSTFAEPGLPPSSQRLLLYSREDYWPYFSACAHWRDGELMSVAKCALGHIPVSRATAGLQGLENRAKDMIHHRAHDPNALATLCGHCRPMRRCPDCPSEYLVEVKLTEEREAGTQRIQNRRFRHAIVVTRWCDLGDGSSPRLSREWAAGNGELEGYDSFAVFGKRAISGTFEAAFTDDTLPGQRIISMNPTGKRLGEEGNSWY